MNDGGPVHPSADPVKVGQITTKLIQAVDDDDNAAVAKLVAEMMECCRPGMSLRQHYVGRALTGLLATPFDASQGVSWTGWASSTAFGMADALIAFEQNEKKD